MANMTRSQFADMRASQLSVPQLVAKTVSLTEGIRNNVYKDTKGNPSIAVGFNLNDKTNQPALDALGLNRDELKAGTRSLTAREINELYKYSSTRAVKDAIKFDPNLRSRPANVQVAIIDMSFNLGLNKLKKFKDMKAALDVNDYNKAADEMQDSLWFDQVKDRGPRMVNIMRTGFTD